MSNRLLTVVNHQFLTQRLKVKVYLFLHMEILDVDRLQKRKEIYEEYLYLHKNIQKSRKKYKESFQR